MESVSPMTQWDIRDTLAVEAFFLGCGHVGKPKNLN